MMSQVEGIAPRRGAHRPAREERVWRRPRATPKRRWSCSIRLWRAEAWQIKDPSCAAAWPFVGVGQAGLGEAYGKTEMEILVEAAKAAVKDAGMSMRDIDGIATAGVNATM